MVIERYRPDLLLLILLAVPGCTIGPEAAATPAVTATASVTATLALAGQMIPQATTTLTPMYTPTATPLSATDVWATLNAPPIIDFTPSPTATPRPTFTPFPGPVWPMLFSGAPCPAKQNFTCSTDLFMHQSSRRYLINSDGSGLTALEEVETFIADLWWYPRFSLDDTRLAYVSRLDNGELHIMLSTVNGSNPIDLGVVPEHFRDLEFLPESDCLAVVSSSPQTPEVRATVARVCVNHPERQLLDSIIFPGLSSGFVHDYRLSPQGDALIAYGRNLEDGVSLYVYEIGGGESPHLLFSNSGPGFIGGSRRWDNGETIRFVFLPVGNSKTFYFVDRTGQILQPLFTFTDVDVDSFGIPDGDWSPDGSEFTFIYVIPNLAPGESGIYIVNIENGEWRQILSEFYVTLIQAWAANTP